MQVTITLLPVSLSLVHIPRSRLNHLSHPVLRQILQPNPAFLNITCNEIELSIFAEHHILHDFEPISRRDRHRQRSRSGSGSSRKAPPNSPVHEPVEISCERWNVLQIDSHNDQIGMVHDLSTPLADAGISILYQSSYMSDFIFVKESRIQDAMTLFELAGFHLYSFNPNPPISSHFSSIIGDDYHSTECTPMSPHGAGAVLTRSIGGVDIPPIPPSENIKPVSVLDDAPSMGQQSPRNNSHSPTSGEVCILLPDLACVGLSDELGVDHWGLKIVKLVAFPDLIPSFHTSTPHPMTNASLDTAPNLIQPSRPDFTSASMFLTSSDGDSDSDSSSGEDDGYFSHSPENTSIASLSSNTSRSYSDLPSVSHSPKVTKSPSKHFVANIAPLSPIVPEPHPLLTNSVPPFTGVHRLSRSAAPKADSRVPFFSFTRTPEGSSLTTDVHLLATLFPPHERHMVICSGELDAADSRLEGGNSFDECDDLSFRGNSLKCLQIDLRRFGLDKHGLVTRFSRVLEESGINHMYSSTFKTANLLVDKKDAIRAQSLLRSC
ncbi:hypothetical protein BYT27DRAFT_7087613 [Phlegmacium glaucopus]|nr:hypothetical protein BYT27DRAFT_7087613 [Phlegmacium glaucopus]